MITKLLVSAAIGAGVARAVAGPVSADDTPGPAQFGSDTNCASIEDCQHLHEASGAQPVTLEQMTAQMQAALAAVQTLPQSGQ
jgi:hypothetical protein